jgi:hypothetical protein
VHLAVFFTVSVQVLFEIEVIVVVEPFVRVEARKEVSRYLILIALGRKVSRSTGERQCGAHVSRGTLSPIGFTY